MSNARSRILVVVRASPIRDRTSALLQSIALQKAAETVRVVVLSPRDGVPEPELAPDGMEYLQAEPDWVRQVGRLAEKAACRWLVFPSSVDRYLPGAFEAVVESGARAGRTVVGPCQITRGGRTVRVGPDPFRFDYFALLSGFNYIAPGATFIDIDRWRDNDGFDPRFPNCPTYEYLLRIGAAGGIDCSPVPILETEAEPFPGIPNDWAVLHASEALLITLGYNRFYVSSGAALGLLAALADRLEPYQHMGFHDEQVLKRLADAAAALKSRYVEQLNVQTASLIALPGTDEDSRARTPNPLGARFKGRVKRVVPPPLWDTLRRVKRAYTAFRSPLY
jgi:hypothetical protein